MKKIKWYEVFIDTPDGTRTIQSFDTLKQAKKYKNNLKNNYNIHNIHIDKWENPNNPKIVKKIK